MKTSETITKLAPALVKLHSEIDHAKKDSANPHFKSSYASLPSVLDAARGPLAANGFAVVQTPRTILDEGGAHALDVTTRLLHCSGEYLEFDLRCRPRDLGPQSIGSAITYLRRYSLQSILAMGSHDDDGNASSPDSGNNSRRSEAPRTAPRAAPPAPLPPSPLPPSREFLPKEEDLEDAALGYGGNVSDVRSEPPAPTPAPAPTEEDHSISIPQWKRLYAITMSGAGTQALQSYLRTEYQITNTKRVTREMYEEVCEWAGNPDNSTATA